MSNYVRTFVLVFISLALSIGFLSCYEADSFVQIIQIHPDNTATVTHQGTNVVYRKDGGSILTGASAIEQAHKDCLQLKEKPTDADRYVDCGTGSLPNLFGDLLKRDPVTPGQVDGYFTVIKPKADKYFDDLAEKKNNKAVREKFVLTPQSLELELQMPAGPIFDAKKSCVFMIQSPWPIQKTNADIVFSSYNLAAWNCSKKESNPPILLILESRKE